MRTLLRRLTVVLGLAALVAPSVASAQSDILLRLRSGSPLGDRGRFDSSGGFVALGTLGLGIIPHSGAGSRMIWHPFKSSFRVGGVDATQWDDGNQGFYSVAGGYNTIAQGNYGTAFGYGSQALQSYGVALGYQANSDGTGAVAIGYRSTADANYSVAIGQRASTNGYSGALVFSDASSSDSVLATATNQFSVRAAGGYRLYTNATKTTGMSMAAGGSSWAVISDRNRKNNFSPLDGEDVLQRLRQVPVSRWQYIDEVDRTTQHIGPMAQDFHAAFGLSTDDKTINMSDLDGVNLAAVKGLDARTAALSATTIELAKENAALKATSSGLLEENAALRSRIAAIEAAQSKMLERLAEIEKRSRASPPD